MSVPRPPRKPMTSASGTTESPTMAHILSGMPALSAELNYCIPTADAQTCTVSLLCHLPHRLPRMANICSMRARITNTANNVRVRARVAGNGRARSQAVRNRPIHLRVAVSPRCPGHLRS